MIDGDIIWVVLVLACSPMLFWAEYWAVRETVREFGFRRRAVEAPAGGEVLNGPGKTGARKAKTATGAGQALVAVKVQFFTAEGRKVVVTLPARESDLESGTVAIKYDPIHPERAAIVGMQAKVRRASYPLLAVCFLSIGTVLVGMVGACVAYFLQM